VEKKFQRAQDGRVIVDDEDYRLPRHCKNQSERSPATRFQCGKLQLQILWKLTSSAGYHTSVIGRAQAMLSGILTGQFVCVSYPVANLPVAALTISFKREPGTCGRNRAPVFRRSHGWA
jgi:hypothetical protein